MVFKIEQILIKYFVKIFLSIVSILDYLPEVYLSKEAKQDRIKKAGIFVSKFVRNVHLNNIHASYSQN